MTKTRNKSFCIIRDTLYLLIYATGMTSLALFFFYMLAVIIVFVEGGWGSILDTPIWMICLWPLLYIDMVIYKNRIIRIILKKLKV
jgi:hypothetical protein